MSQKDVANCLGIAEATLSRWLSQTQIQSRSMDRLLRVFFAFPEVRAALGNSPRVPLLGLADTLQSGTQPRPTESPG